MNTAMTALYGAGLFVLGAIVGGGGMYLVHGHDQRDGMETIAALQNWRLTCAPRTMKNGECLIQSGIVEKGTNNVIAELSIGQKDKADVLTIVAPLGVFIPTGVRLSLGDISKTIPFKTCIMLNPPLGCVATLPIDSAIATALSKDDGGTITLVAANGQSVPVNFSLHGYNDAIADRAIDMSARN